MGEFCTEFRRWRRWFGWRQGRKKGKERGKEGKEGRRGILLLPSCQAKQSCPPQRGGPISDSLSSPPSSFFLAVPPAGSGGMFSFWTRRSKGVLLSSFLLLLLPRSGLNSQMDTFPNRGKRRGRRRGEEVPKNRNPFSSFFPSPPRSLNGTWDGRRDEDDGETVSHFFFSQKILFQI